ncbi:hypothetical protein KQX54_017371 [Cotesia glomerata]|uniref:Uncharacterized protein n=1 Tax=Cotesia glomerata TaxID=32391 RepID=A0AAV7IEC1_COTGL|nr:hypothetical protein KQX54_017371 [Cotesia glomerata]
MPGLVDRVPRENSCGIQLLVIPPLDPNVCQLVDDAKFLPSLPHAGKLCLVGDPGGSPYLQPAHCKLLSRCKLFRCFCSARPFISRAAPKIMAVQPMAQCSSGSLHEYTCKYVYESAESSKPAGIGRQRIKHLTRYVIERVGMNNDKQKPG